MLPPAYAAALEAGLAELELALSPAARQAIDDHVRLLLAWNAAINLTAIREPAEIAVRHVVDSLAAATLLADIGGFLDLGSGGGFPGIPLAAALPVERVALVDSVGKKASFLAAAVEAADLSPRVGVAAARAEELASEARHRERWPAVTARAVGSLAELVELAFPLLAVGGRLVAWKRGDVAAELLAARRAVGALGGGSIDEAPVSVTGLPGHLLVVVTKRGRTGAEFPRDPAVRRREPW
jgi:16S rRNA (guanine527-N7)-methyltransferase